MNKVIFCCTLFSLLAACGGSESLDTESTSQQRIAGTIFDSQNGTALSGATISTLPATEEVTSGSDGSYSLRNLVNADTEYDVLANKLGYRPDRARITVAPNSTSTADFQLDPIVNGLATSANTVNFSLGTDRTTFLLTSTVADTGFTIQAADSWLTATPSQGNISSSENKIISLNIDRSLLTGDRAATQLIINTSNGTDGVVMDITADLTINVGNDTTNANTETVGSSGNDPTNGNNNNAALPEPAVGAPGSPVNCRSALPCTWISEDSDYEFIIRFSDAMTTTSFPVSLGFDEPYTVGYEFRVNSADATVVFTADSTALTTNDDVLSSYVTKAPDTGQSLATDYLVYQNTGMRITQQFDQNVIGTGTMQQVTLRTIANNIPVVAEFTNLPYGREPSQDIDCQFTLPCTWKSADTMHQVTVNTVSIDATSKNLDIEFSVLTQTIGANITLDYDTNASGNNLRSFGGSVRNTLAGQSSTGLETQPATANQPLNGSVEFRRQETATTLQHLTRLQLHIYENLGFSPLWNPIWFNLPLSN